MRKLARDDREHDDRARGAGFAAFRREAAAEGEAGTRSGSGHRVGKEGDDISQVSEAIPSPTDKGVVATSTAFADLGRLTRFG